MLFAALGKTLFGSREIAKLKDNKRSCNRLFYRLFTINIISSIFVSFIFLLSLLPKSVLPKAANNTKYSTKVAFGSEYPDKGLRDEESFWRKELYPYSGEE